MRDRKPDPGRSILGGMATRRRCSPAILASALALTLVGGKGGCSGGFVPLPTPAQPHGQLVERLWDFLSSDVGTFPAMVCPPAPGEAPYFYSYAIDPGGDLFPVSYPAFTAAVGIRAFLAYHVYSGESAAVERAKAFADFVLSGLTPASDAQHGAWAYPGLPYSTLFSGCFGLLPGEPLPDGESIELDKAAMFADALLDLYEATDDAGYRDAAVSIGDTLLAKQRPDGSWPFRVIPWSGAIYRDYTSDQIAFYRLMRHLESLEGGGAYGASAEAAWQWILANPVLTLDWNGFYEDVDDATSKTNYAALETMRALLRRADENPLYDNYAWALWVWIKETFLITEAPYAPLVPAIWEQTGFVSEDGVRAGTASSTIQWALAAAELGFYVDDPELIELAAAASNVITSVQQADGRLYTIVADANGGPRLYPYDWYEQELIPLGMTLELMGELPELAPSDENHVLLASSAVQAIAYGASSVSYSTRGPGFERARLVAKPLAVSSDGAPLLEVVDLDAVLEGWTWDAGAQVLSVRHLGTAQIVTLP